MCVQETDAAVGESSLCPFGSLCIFSVGENRTVGLDSVLGRLPRAFPSPFPSPPRLLFVLPGLQGSYSNRIFQACLIQFSLNVSVSSATLVNLSITRQQKR